MREHRVAQLLAGRERDQLTARVVGQAQRVDTPHRHGVLIAHGDLGDCIEHKVGARVVERQDVGEVELLWLTVRLRDDQVDRARGNSLQVQDADRPRVVGRREGEEATILRQGDRAEIGLRGDGVLGHAVRPVQTVIGGHVEDPRPVPRHGRPRSARVALAEDHEPAVRDHAVENVGLVVLRVVGTGVARQEHQFPRSRLSVGRSPKLR